MTTIIKLISGAQTGADRGGLNAAIALGLPYGGSVPKGRKAEDGTIPAHYQGLTELPHANYIIRTRKNVEDADLTLIFTYGELTGGSLKTAEFAIRCKKPWLHIDMQSPNPSSIISWLQKQAPAQGILNIAGSRESNASGLEDAVTSLLLQVLPSFLPPQHGTL